MQVTFSQAAQLLGFKSRSTLYRLKDAELSRYLRPPARAGGAQMLELEPIGLPSLRDWMNTILQSQAKTAAPQLPALAFGSAPPAPAAPSPATAVDPLRVAAGLAQLVAGLPEDSIPTLAESRERRAHYLAEMSRLQAMKERGDLLPRNEITNGAFSVARITRDMFLALPGRLAPQLVGVADTPTAFALLDKEIRHALNYLSDATERLGQ